MAIHNSQNIETIRQEMIHFFEQKIIQLRNNQLSPLETRRWTDFYMEQIYRNNNGENNNEESVNNESNENIDISISGNPDTLKYFFLGWYIYEQLLANLETVQNESNENNENQQEGE